MTRMTPVLKKLYARKRAREDSEHILDMFLSGMFSIVEREMNIEGCKIKIYHKAFQNEGKELDVIFTIELPKEIADRPLNYSIIIKRHGQLFILSSDNKQYNLQNDNPELAADAFFEVLEIVA